MSKLLGIDVSKWQGNINFKKVRDEGGVKRVILRAGYGAGNYDQAYVNNAQALVNFNMWAGIYHFSYAYTTNMAADEGNFAVKAAKKFWDKCYIAYDAEYDTINNARKHGIELDKTTLTVMAIMFLRVVSFNGFIPVLYLNEDYWLRMYDIDKIKAAIPNLRIWYATYTKKNAGITDVEKVTAPKRSCDIYQFSSTGRISGITGNVDTNVFYEDDILDADPVEAVKDENVMPATKDPVKNINILNFQKACNVDGYSDSQGRKLVEDGIDGPNTQAARKKIALNVSWAYNQAKVGSKGDVVKWVQTRLNEMGLYSVFSEDPLAVDGLYGPNTRKHVLEFQRQHNLSVDGIAGYNTLSTLFYV